MKYLLDVNALIAPCIAQHQFHSRVATWINSQRGAEFLTSSITEIGFVRIAAQVPIYTLDGVQAKAILTSVKSSMPLGHIADANDIRALPGWVDKTRTSHRWTSPAACNIQWRLSGHLGSGHSGSIPGTVAVERNAPPNTGPVHEKLKSTRVL